MRRVRWEAVCGWFGLGAPQGRPELITRGSNEVWRVPTERGVVAVKRLVAHAGQPWFLPRLRAAYGVECRAWSAGVPMPQPVAAPVTGWWLAHLDGALWRVHHWLDGRTPHPGDVDVGLAAAAGRLLATIHASAAPGQEEPEFGAAPISVEGWRAHARQVAGMAPEVAGALQAAACDIAWLHARTYIPEPCGARVASHADFDPKNALVLVDGRLAVVDWDAARTVATGHELLQVALDWAATPTGEIDPRRLVAVVDAYHDSGGVPLTVTPQVFGNWVGSWVWWLQHTLSDRIPDGTQRAAARRDARDTLARLDHAVHNIDRWLDLLAATRRRHPQ